jgi:predicted homoserine dehydrogenase-like protein
VILVDRELERREAAGRPVRVGLVGTGFMGSGIVRQMLANPTGIRLVAASNRTLEKARAAFLEAGGAAVEHVESPAALEAAIAAGRPAITEDAALLCEADGIDAIIEVTGDVEFSAGVALRAIEHGKHVVLMNAELDATVGPILKVHADRAGVVITNADGDQPGVIMNLYRFVQGIGFQPVMAGNIKGLQDVRRTPETQRGFAEQHGQNVHMVTSFADGTKVSMEMAIVANGTGLRCGTRGMYGPECGHVKEAVDLFPMEQLMDGGLVDYVLGAEPSPGVFVLGYHEDPVQQRYMDLYKMGDGPLYAFYTPYHLCHFEAPTTAARAVLFDDAALAPLGGPVCEVVATAKRDLAAGEVLDGIGGFLSYGQLENHDTARAERLLPMGLAIGGRLLRDVPIDAVLTYDDVELPPGRLADRLRAEQDAHFAPSSVAEAETVSR